VNNVRQGDYTSFMTGVEKGEFLLFFSFSCALPFDQLLKVGSLFST
jgi:hypothetical protein